MNSRSLQRTSRTTELLLQYSISKPIKNHQLIRKYNHVSGVIFNPDWKERRRFLLVSMRDFGLGKRSLDDRIGEEAEALVKELEGKDEQILDMTTLLPYVTSNIICSIILGQR